MQVLSKILYKKNKKNTPLKGVNDCTGIKNLQFPGVFSYTF